LIQQNIMLGTNTWSQVQVQVQVLSISSGRVRAQILRGGPSDRRQNLHEQVADGESNRVDVAGGDRAGAAVPLL